MSLLKKNKIIHSGLLLMLLSAFLHMGILALHFLFTFDSTPFNFFRIIGLDLFFPDFVFSTLGNYTASICVVMLFAYIYIIFLKEKNKI